MREDTALERRRPWLGETPAVGAGLLEGAALVSLPSSLKASPGPGPQGAAIPDVVGSPWKVSCTRHEVELTQWVMLASWQCLTMSISGRAAGKRQFLLDVVPTGSSAS